MKFMQRKTDEKPNLQGRVLLAKAIKDFLRDGGSIERAKELLAKTIRSEDL